MQDAKIDTFGVGENMITAKPTPVLGGGTKSSRMKKTDRSSRRSKSAATWKSSPIQASKKSSGSKDKENHQAIADSLAPRDEVIPADEYLLCRSRRRGSRNASKIMKMRESQEQIFDHGRLVYTVPTTEEVKNYCTEQMDTFMGRSQAAALIRTVIMSTIPAGFTDLKQELTKRIRFKFRDRTKGERRSFLFFFVNFDFIMSS